MSVLSLLAASYRACLSSLDTHMHTHTQNIQWRSTMSLRAASLWSGSLTLAEAQMLSLYATPWHIHFPLNEMSLSDVTQWPTAVIILCPTEWLSRGGQLLCSHTVTLPFHAGAQLTSSPLSSRRTGILLSTVSFLHWRVASINLNNLWEYLTWGQVVLKAAVEGGALGPETFWLERTQNTANKIAAQVLVLPSSSYIQRKRGLVKSLSAWIWGQRFPHILQEIQAMGVRKFCLMKIR